MLSFVRYYRFVEILSYLTYREESSRLRPLRHRGFHGEMKIEDFTTSDGAIRGLNSSCAVVVSFES